MSTFSLLFLCAVLYICNAHPHVISNGKTIYSLEDAENYFNDFIKTHGKVYSDDAEKNMRFEIFKQNLLKINNFNADPENHAEFGINRFADLTEEEFLQKYTGFKSSNKVLDSVKLGIVPEVKNLPAQFDWRDENAVTSVKDQGPCRASWAFSAAGTVEGAFAIKYKKLVNVSVQQLVECSSFDMGCHGGDPRTAVDYYTVHGAELESDYPYVGGHFECKYDEKKVAVNLTSYISFADVRNETKLQEILVSIGPISLTIDLVSLQLYIKGILDHCKKYYLTHGVLLVGYGTENGIPYWTLKNSWGATYGEEGYVRLKRGVNECNILNPTLIAAQVI